MVWQNEWEKRVNGREVAVWGIGRDASFAVESIHSCGGDVSFFISRDWLENPDFMDKKVFGKEILNRDEHFVVIGSSLYINEITDELHQLGFEQDNDFDFYISGLKLPRDSCAYEVYDPITLKPLNYTTCLRLSELGWSEADFKDKSVLDIGANSGLLSLEAFRLGAKKITAYDIQDVYVDFFSRVVAAKRVPITVSKRGFMEINPSDDAADVVLFMEVLHWAVEQGNSIEDVVDRLAALTRETLYIEFPWSVDEPAIINYTKLTCEKYSSDRVIDLLSRYFKEVRVMRFMRYFGFNSKSRRVLLRCSGKRLESPVLREFPQAWPLDIGLPYGSYENRIIYTPEEALFVKNVAPHSRLLKLAAEKVADLFDGLHNTNTSFFLSD